MSKLKIETTTIIGGEIVRDTGQKLMGHRLFEPESSDDNDLKLYAVDGNGEVKCIVRVSSDCSQNCGYISGWEFETVK